MGKTSENKNKEIKVKKRKINTNEEQYEIYLCEMECDYIFRNGILNPTLVEDDYMKNKWQLLTEELNSVGRGPQLSCEEWKRRFKDWKNTTRAKYRKLTRHRSKQDGGDGEHIKMSRLEEHGLSLWGTSCNTQGTEILSILPTPVEQNDNNSENEKVIRKLKTSAKNKCEPVATNLLESCNKGNITKDLVEELKNLVQVYQETENNKLELEKKKLEFTIKKYKFENPSFQFDF